MIAGTMDIVYFFIESKMPNIKWAIIALSLFAGLISAFVDNVATVLMVAPVALTISKKLKVSPVTSIIAISVSSNLQGAATLVGDTTYILLGAQTGMDFLDFFVYRGKVGLFWVVQISAVVSAFVLMFVFRKHSQPISDKDRTKVEDYFPSALLLGMIVLLICASFIPDGPWKPSVINGLICVSLPVWAFSEKRDMKSRARTL